MSEKENAFLSTSYTSMKTYEDDKANAVTWVEFTKEAEITDQRAKELIDLGWLQPINPEAEDLAFKQVDIFKARKANRLCMDFELPSLAGAIIVDLLEKIDDLEARLQEKG